MKYSYKGGRLEGFLEKSIKAILSTVNDISNCYTLCKFSRMIASRIEEMQSAVRELEKRI